MQVSNQYFCFSFKSRLSFTGNGFAFMSKQTRKELMESCSIDEIFTLEQIGTNTNPGIFENFLMKVIDEKQSLITDEDVGGKRPLLVV